MQQEDCKVAFITAKDAKSAKEILAMDIVLGGFSWRSWRPWRFTLSKATLQFACIM